MQLKTLLTYFTIFVTLTNIGNAQNLPWQKAKLVKADSADFLLDGPWSILHSTLEKSDVLTPAGMPTFEWNVTIPPNILALWPSIEIGKKGFDFSGYDTLRFYIKGKADVDPIKLIFFLCDTSNGGWHQTLMPLSIGPEQWKQIDYPLNNAGPAQKIDRVHFFMCASDYSKGGSFQFHIGGFQLLKHTPTSEGIIVPDGAACKMSVTKYWSGLTKFIEKQPALSADFVIETGSRCAIEKSDLLQLRFRELFSGKVTEKTISPNFKAAPGSVSHFKADLPVEDLPGGFYIVTADLLRNGSSLLHGIVGSDQFYIMKKNEKPAYSALSARLGMAYMVEDIINGGTYAYTSMSLPNSYDPFKPSTYPQFKELYVACADKDTEQYGAAMGGLYFARLAFQKLNDDMRVKAVENLMKREAFFMMDSMQRPDGSIRHIVNENPKIVEDFNGSFEVIDNQVGEWLTAMSYGILALQDGPENDGFVRTMRQSCRRAVEYLVRHTKGESSNRVFVNDIIYFPNREPGREIMRRHYSQGGVDCTVYHPRTFSGVAFYTNVALLAGENVPDEWWQVMNNTIKWFDRKMNSDGWFDWQCGDKEESGCHTYLGNMYAGEAALHYYLAAREAGRHNDAEFAAKVAKRAFRYLTDSCTSEGTRWTAPTDLWVGPYCYWLLELYRREIAEDAVLAEFQKNSRDFWIGRKWRDFFRDRHHETTGANDELCSRGSESGSLTIAALAFPAIYLMTETQPDWKWPITIK